jgi:hypothetical protein
MVKFSEWEYAKCHVEPEEKDIEKFIRVNVYTDRLVRASMDLKTLALRNEYPNVQTWELRDWFLNMWKKIIEFKIKELRQKQCILPQSEKEHTEVNPKKRKVPDSAVDDRRLFTPESRERDMNPVVEKTLEYWVRTGFVGFDVLKKWVDENREVSVSQRK